MSFLDRFPAEQRKTFLDNSERLEVGPGQYLMRRGEPGGDVFVVASGQLEVVDRRPNPEVVLAVMSPGQVVGEVGFLDNSPRSADVRAGNGAVVHRWRKEDLQALLQREPKIASTFYETIARVASGRLRDLTTTAVASAMNRDGARDVGNERLRKEITGLLDERRMPLDSDRPNYDADGGWLT
jgi:CRP-like cAMP-binding protein